MQQLIESPRTMRSVGIADDWTRTTTGLYVPQPPTKADRYRYPVAVDLFAGAGGMSVGFHQAGFHVAAALEANIDAAVTYLVNLGAPYTRVYIGERALEDSPARQRKLHAEKGGMWITADELTGGQAGTGWIRHVGCAAAGLACGPSHMGIGYDGEYNAYLAEINAEPPHGEPCLVFYLADVRELTGQRIAADLGLAVGEIDAIAGGPPCQGFSMAGRRNVHDPRNSLVFEFARLVIEAQPKTMVMENVPGMVSMVTPEGGLVIDELYAYLEAGGIGTRKQLQAAIEGRDASIVERHRKVRSGPAPEPTDDVDEALEHEQLAAFA